MVRTLLPQFHVPRAVWHSIGLIVAVILAYLVWRGYQSPDFILDLSSLRFCSVQTNAG